MSLASDKYDIILNGQGYVLFSESYRKNAQQPFNPRFSTGDPSLTDLSFWQFSAQESFIGGAGQDDISDLTKYQRSAGWSLLSGKPRLCGGSAPIPGVTPTELAATEAVSGATCSIPAIHRFLPFGMTADGQRKLVLLGPSASAFLADGTRSTLRAASATVVGLDQILCLGSTRWHRQAPSAAGGYLAIGRVDGANHYLTVYDQAYNVVLNQSISNICKPRAIVPASQDSILCFGPAAPATGMALGIWRGNMTANTWSVTGAYSYISDLPGTASPHWCKDADGNIIVVLTAPLNLMGHEAFHSTLLLMTSAHALETTAPVVTDTIDYPDLILTGAFLVGSNVFMLGCRILPNGNFRTCVVRYPKTIVWESDKESSNVLDVIPRGLYTDGHNEVLFADSNKDTGEQTPIMRLRGDGIVEEAFSTPEDRTAGRREVSALYRLGPKLYSYDRQQTAIMLSDGDTSGDRTTDNDLVFYTSRYGGNTPLVDKTLYSVSLKLSEAVGAGEELLLKVNGTLIKTITSADGTEFEVVLTSDLTASTFQVSLTAASDCTWGGSPEKVSLRFVPTQFKKWAWAMGIRCDRNLKLADGTRESSTGKELFAALQTAWESNTPITFVDLDKTSYTVLVTDLKVSRNLISERGGDFEESICFVELLQV